MIGELIGVILLGLVAGYLGKALMPGKDPGGCWFTIALGVAGSLLGWFVFTYLLGIGDEDKFDFGGILGAILGVMILLGIYRAIAPKPKPTATQPPARERPPRRRR